MLMPNNRTMTIKMTRGEVIDILMACGVMAEHSEKFVNIHNKIYEQLYTFDEKLYEKETK